jgi:outer membrane protein assembly factor BamB
MHPKRKSSWALICLALGLATTAACSGRNIHPELRENPDVLVRQWTLPTSDFFTDEAGVRGYEYSSPIAFEQTLIFGSRKAGLVALYPQFMKVRWVLPISGGVLSEIAEEKGKLFFGGGDGFIYCVAADTGQVLWRYEVRNPFVSKPALHAGRLFITTSDDTVYALDAGTGKWLWHFRRRSTPESTVRGAATPIIDQGEVITGLSDGFLVSLNQEDGALKWERKLHSAPKFTDVDASPILHQGVIYASSYDGSLFALKRQGGDVLWKFDGGASRSVKVEGDRIFLPSTDGHIYALQKDNAKVIWKFELDGGVPTDISLNDKYLFVASSYQYLYVLEHATGRAVYRFHAGYDSGFASAPFFEPQSKQLYALSSGGNLYSFSAPASTPRNGKAPSWNPYR